MAESSEIPLPMNETFSKDGSQEPSILPRSAWKSKLAFFKTILKAKQALDRIEKESKL